MRTAERYCFGVHGIGIHRTAGGQRKKAWLCGFAVKGLLNLLLCCRSALQRKAHPHKQGCLGWLRLQDTTPSWMEPSQASEMALNKRVPPVVAVESSSVSLPS